MGPVSLLSPFLPSFPAGPVGPDSPSRPSLPLSTSILEQELSSSCQSTLDKALPEIEETFHAQVIR